MSHLRAMRPHFCVPQLCWGQIAFLTVLFVALFAGCALAQDPAAGILPFSTQAAGKIDSIDLATGSVFIKIPVRSKTGKTPMSFSLVGQSHVFYSLGGIGVDGYSYNGASYNFTTANGGLSAGLLGYRVRWSAGGDYGQCGTHKHDYQITNFSITDSLGTVHSLGDSLIIDQYGCVGTSGSGMMTDGSGYSLSVVWGIGNPSVTISDRSGNSASVTGWSGSVFTSSSDPDGVTVSETSSAVTDSLGATFLSYSFGSSGSPDTYSWTDINSQTQSATVSYTQKTVQTNFGCPGVTDIPATAAYLPSSITLPTGESYTVTYEPTPVVNNGNVTGRIAQITLSSGGYFAYSYSGGHYGLDCNVYVVPTLTRTVYDASSNTTSTQTYINSNTGNGNNVTVTEYYPYAYGNANNNKTVYNFIFESEYQSQVSEYNSSSTLLRQTTTCYNGNFTNCSTTSSLPGQRITQTDVYASLGGTQPSLVETVYDLYGNVSQVKQYDWGATMPPTSAHLISTTYTPRGSWNSSTHQCGGLAGISDRPCYIATLDASSNPASQVYYTYDSLGHKLSENKMAQSPSNYLLTTYGYNSSGVLSSITDPNTGQTWFSNFTCNGILPQTITYPNGLSSSQTWNCDGGVLTSSTDVNQQPTQYGYIDSSTQRPDPFWRVTSVTDPVGYVTNTHYVPATQGGPASQESVLTFNNNNSTVDVLQTFDSLGRVHVSQRRQSPSSTNYDSTETDYDLNGRVARVTVPYSATAGGTCSTCAATLSTYDALGRPLSVVDGGGGYTTYQYPNQDALVTVGPAPSGENLKSRQLEYDGLNRLASVCEILSSGGTSCGQSGPASGYKTAYSYSVPAIGGSQMSVTQGSQSRIYLYDGMGRLTSETNPEWGPGTATYTYDSDSSGTCTGSYNGDLVKRVDNAGNVTCYTYDTSHRKLNASYPSGPNSASTPSKTFIYDATTFSCTNNAVPNVGGRLAEAYTGPSTARITDIAYCYSARGEIADVFEATQNSRGTYHTSAGYYANGALQYLNGVPVQTAFSFGVDGEGRTVAAVTGSVSNVVCSPSNNPLQCASYNTSGQPTGVTLGSGDSDTWSYDSNTGRMNGYQFNVGPTGNVKSVVTSLSWNANGTLRSLQTTQDPFNSANVQLCNFNYDDLGRLAGHPTNGWTIDCGNGGWQQLITLDSFGNINKSGTSSFAANYTPTTNQEQSVGNCTPTYDANGNLTKDCAFASPYTYAWDADGNPINLNGTTVTYDAFDRVIEKNNSTQILYTPIGKTAIMAGQNMNRIDMPLPGGDSAVYEGTIMVPFHYRHADWLGSARFASTSSQGVMYDRAFAPYGESYAGSSLDLDFTGQNQDTIAGLYGFLYREYNQVQGRWISPDPSGLSAVDPTNPQSWNRYAYAMNNPLANIDPLGLECVWDDGSYDSADDPDTGSYTQCHGAGGMWVEPEYFATLGLADWSPDPSSFLASLVDANNGPLNPNCGITVKCRGIQTDNLGKLGFQHCDAQVTDSSGAVWSLSGGPQQNYISITALNAWATSPPTEPFTGTTVYQGNSCTAAGCMIQSTQVWNQDIVKPEYSPVTGPNSNTWLKGTAAGCGVSLPINTWGSIW